MSNTLKKEFNISSYDLNPLGKARLTAMANFFQEMAYKHANQLGFGYDDMMQKQTVWVLSRMRIRINMYPVWDDTIWLETWHRGMNRIFGMRDFRVSDASGSVLGMASTAWLVLDSRTKRPVRPKEELLHESLHEDSVFDRDPEKIILPGILDVIETRKVVFSDLDIVAHVNNVKYMEWCIDAATNSSTEFREIRELEINFVHEALLGDHIEISMAQVSGKGSYFQASREEDKKEIFRARLVWEQSTQE